MGHGSRGEAQRREVVDGVRNIHTYIHTYIHRKRAMEGTKKGGGRCIIR
jgi:hypothetical protein